MMDFAGQAYTPAKTLESASYMKYCLYKQYLFQNWNIWMKNGTCFQYLLCWHDILSCSLTGEVVTYTCTALRSIAIEWTVTPGIPNAAFIQEDTLIEKTIGDFQLALTSRIPNGTSDLTSTLTVTTTASHNGTIIQCVSDNGKAKQELSVATSKLCTFLLTH